MASALLCSTSRAPLATQRLGRHSPAAALLTQQVAAVTHVRSTGAQSCAAAA